MEPGRSRGKVGTIAALVAQAPKEDTWVVLVTLGHTDDAVKEGIVPVGRRSQCAPQSMGFDIGLIHHIHADTVAQLIPTRTVRIVTRADSIDVSLLHQSQVLLHQFLRHDTSRIRIMLMTVYATNLDGFAINEQLSVMNRDGTETHLLDNLLGDGAITLLQLECEGIEMGMLSRP